jgi:hypothetical protein
VDWAKEQLRAHPDQPFFAFINFGETHFPYRLDGQAGLEDEAEARSHRRRATIDKEQEHAFDEAMWRLQVAATELFRPAQGRVAGLLRRDLMAGHGRDVRRSR